VDAAFAPEKSFGATAISPPEDKPYQERQCGIKDSFGNTWWISNFAG
ncbi:MAG: PhnB protein, partial [Limisphaerales bacterium]